MGLKNILSRLRHRRTKRQHRDRLFKPVTNSRELGPLRSDPAPTTPALPAQTQTLPSRSVGATFTSATMAALATVVSALVITDSLL